MFRSLKNENILARVYEPKRGLSRFASDQVRNGSQKRGLSRSSAFGFQRVHSTRIKLLLEAAALERKTRFIPVVIPEQKYDQRLGQKRGLSRLVTA
jgi:hypothetical protein